MIRKETRLRVCSIFGKEPHKVLLSPCEREWSQRFETLIDAGELVCVIKKTFQDGMIVREEFSISVIKSK